MRKSPQLVAGVDGCRAGWLVVLAEVLRTEVRVRSVEVMPKFDRVLEMGCRAVAADIPIGLPECAEPGGRGADRAARARLGPRRSSVFSPPIRAVLDCTDYPAALEVMRASSDHSIGFTKQCWNIVPKIREVDAMLRGRSAYAVYECHPELSFAAMAGQPMVNPKATANGAEERRSLLKKSGIPLQMTPIKGAKIDDILDAHACLWTAARIARNEHQSIPVVPEFDGVGLPMRIVF